MRTVRRLYFYAVAFISLEVVLWGLIGLLRTTFSPDAIGGGAERLAQALALILVGVPVFGLHWWVAQRGAHAEMDEHASGLRAFFLYAVLLATLIPIVQNFLALLNRLLLQAFGMPPNAMFGASQNLSDNLIAMLMNGIVAAYFIVVLRADWKEITPKETFADIRRIYRYVWVIYTLVMLIAGVQQLLRFVLEIPPSAFGPLTRAAFINGLTLLLLGAPLWFFAWKTVQDSLTNQDERESLLRLGILYLLTLSGVITILTSSGIVLDVFLRRILGEAMTLPELFQQVGGPLSIGIPLAGVWAYYGHWLNRSMAEIPDAPRRAGIRRLYYYILSAIGLGATFIGLAILLSFVVDTFLGDVLWTETLRPRLAGSLATLFAGLPLWLLTWHPMQAEALASGDTGDHARRSIIRKSYLYLVLFASVIGGMAMAGILLYTLLNQLLGGFSPQFLQDLFKSLEILTLFVLMGLYHGYSLRRDGRMAAHALAARHALFPALIFDSGDGTFAQAVLMAIQKQTPRLPAAAQSISQPIPEEALATVKAVILPADLALNSPEALRLWLGDFNGSKLIVQRAAPSRCYAQGWVWVGGAQADVNQAALTLRQLAEGQEVRQRAPASGWMVAVYIIAALFGLQVLFMLFSLGLSFLVD